MVSFQPRAHQRAHLLRLAELTIGTQHASDMNIARVEFLKVAIRNGELQRDSGKIADALITDSLSWLQSQ